LAHQAVQSFLAAVLEALPLPDTPQALSNPEKARPAAPAPAERRNCARESLG
jgi:hypothetical protein